MPELPEVETVVRTLETKLGHCTIESVEVRWPKIIDTPDIKTFCERLKGQTIQSYGRIGKYLMFDLGDQMLIAHMRMEGKFYVQKAEEPYDHKHVHLLIKMRDGFELRYHDTRKFGRFALYDKREDPYAYPALKHVGLDAFDERLTPTYLYQQMHKRRITLKQALLDQQIMAGVGNIYADEICFALRMHPATKIWHLRKKDYETMLTETRRILSGAARAGGTTIRSYTSSVGVDGRFQLELNVHAREGEPCPICQGMVKKITLATRGTYYCPACQRKR